MPRNRPGRPGRPRLPAHQRRTSGLLVRLTQLEHETLRSRAAAARLPLAHYVRTTALSRHLKASHVPAANLAISGELAAIGNNLNQAVHLAHLGLLTPSLLPTLKELLDMIDRYRRELYGLQPPAE